MSDSERTADVRLRAAVEASPSGLLMTDGEGRIVLVNREVERLFGYSRGELLGRSVEILVPARFRSAHAGFRAGFGTDAHPRSLGAGRDLQGLRKDGEEIPVEIGLTPVDTEEGPYILAAIVDISERKRAEAERRSLEEQLRHARKMEAVGTLAGGIAHDFNNILAVVTMYAELLMESAPGLGMQDDARSVLTAARRGKELVQRILSFSRRRETARAPLSVSEVVRETEPLLRASLPAGIEIRLATADGDEVLGDATS
ncbi:MAG TPA: PAS domain S-box protein, partial [Longimicrobiales bacterium]|nr:PAS domain S-box protein [Longimicrobiales bacterium]